MSTTMKRKNRGKDIVFDPEERRNYLRGFSERKQQRRAFGLAMQKVKDRTAKLEDRKEHRKSELERIEEAERQKRTLLDEAVLGRLGEVDDDTDILPTADSKTATYQDKASADKWGGQVIVTTTIATFSDESDDEEEGKTKQKQSIDKRQRYAGDVTKFINKMKGSMPAKKKSTHGGQPQKGIHGAASMKGIGGATNLKLAKKALSKVNTKVAAPAKGKGKKRRK